SHHRRRRSAYPAEGVLTPRTACPSLEPHRRDEPLATTETKADPRRSPTTTAPASTETGQGRVPAITRDASSDFRLPTTPNREVGAGIDTMDANGRLALPHH